MKLGKNKLPYFLKDIEQYMKSLDIIAETNLIT